MVLIVGRAMGEARRKGDLMVMVEEVVVLVVVHRCLRAMAVGLNQHNKGNLALGPKMEERIDDNFTPTQAPVALQQATPVGAGLLADPPPTVHMRPAMMTN